MRIAIENKQNKIGFFKIDGRKLNQFIEKAEKVNASLLSIWTYSHIERNDKSVIGMFKNVKIIK